MGWWPFGRTSGPHPPGPEAASPMVSSPDGRPEVVAGPQHSAGSPAWSTLPTIQRSVAPIAPIAPLDVFTASLTTGRNPGFLAPLGHAVVDAGGGEITGLTRPVPTGAGVSGPFGPSGRPGGDLGTVGIATMPSYDAAAHTALPVAHPGGGPTAQRAVDAGPSRHWQAGPRLLPVIREATAAGPSMVSAPQPAPVAKAPVVSDPAHVAVQRVPDPQLADGPTENDHRDASAAVASAAAESAADESPAPGIAPDDVAAPIDDVAVAMADVAAPTVGLVGGRGPLSTEMDASGPVSVSSGSPSVASAPAVTGQGPDPATLPLTAPPSRPSTVPVTVSRSVSGAPGPLGVASSAGTGPTEDRLGDVLSSSSPLSSLSPLSPLSSPSPPDSTVRPTPRRPGLGEPLPSADLPQPARSLTTLATSAPMPLAAMVQRMQAASETQANSGARGAPGAPGATPASAVGPTSGPSGPTAAAPTPDAPLVGDRPSMWSSPEPQAVLRIPDAPEQTSAVRGGDSSRSSEALVAPVISPHAHPATAPHVGPMAAVSGP